jgi:hypothetical protein
MCAQFPEGPPRGPLTPSDLCMTMYRRKRGMLESAMRHPIPTTIASAAPLPNQAMSGSALQHPMPTTTGSASRTAAETEAGACSDADAEEEDHVYEDMPLRVEMNEVRWDEVDWCMLTLLWANKPPAAGPTVSYPSVRDLLLNPSLLDEWRSALNNGLSEGIVMDQDAVARAVAHWDKLQNKDPLWSNAFTSESATSVVQHVTRVVRAAARDGQGVIVHPGCVVVPAFD